MDNYLYKNRKNFRYIIESHKKSPTFRQGLSKRSKFLSKRSKSSVDIHRL